MAPVRTRTLLVQLLQAASNRKVWSIVLKTVDDNLLLSSIGSVFQAVDAAKNGTGFRKNSKRKSETASDTMLVDHVVRYFGYNPTSFKKVSINQQKQLLISRVALSLPNPSLHSVTSQSTNADIQMNGLASFQPFQPYMESALLSFM